MSTNKLIVGIIILGLILGGVIYMGGSRDVGQQVKTPEFKTYVSDTLGIKFDYPQNYILDERNTGSGARGRYTISLFEDTPGNRALLNGEVQGEGPTSISVDIFQNDLDKENAYKWVTGNANSNFKLGNGELASTTVSGIAALDYTWSGLYEGRSKVVSTPNYIYMFSVTRLNPDDQILKDFETVIDSVVITQ